MQNQNVDEFFYSGKIFLDNIVNK